MSWDRPKRAASSLAEVILRSPVMIIPQEDAWNASKESAKKKTKAKGRGRPRKLPSDTAPDSQNGDTTPSDATNGIHKPDADMDDDTPLSAFILPRNNEESTVHENGTKTEDGESKKEIKHKKEKKGKKKEKKEKKKEKDVDKEDVSMHDDDYHPKPKKDQQKHSPDTPSFTILKGDPIKSAKRVQKERNKTFTYLKTNSFASRSRRVDDEDSTSACFCINIEGEVSCGSNCVNRLTFIECHPKCCPCGPACGNQRFQRQDYAKVSLIETQNKGYGLVCLEDMEPGQFVYEYCGEVIPNEMCHERLAAASAESNFYFLTLDSRECIDASNKGNLARFMNHSCSPNCQTQKWYVCGEMRVGLFAMRYIPAGTELTFDYNFERYGTAKQRCYCDAPNCRGFLGEKPKQKEEVKKQGSAKRKDTARKSAGMNVLSASMFPANDSPTTSLVSRRKAAPNTATTTTSTPTLEAAPETLPLPLLGQFSTQTLSDGTLIPAQPKKRKPVSTSDHSQYVQPIIYPRKDNAEVLRKQFKASAFTRSSSSSSSSSKSSSSSSSSTTSARSTFYRRKSRIFLVRNVVITQVNLKNTYDRLLREALANPVTKRPKQKEKVGPSTEDSDISNGASPADAPVSYNVTPAPKPGRVRLCSKKRGLAVVLKKMGKDPSSDFLSILERGLGKTE
eukprot:TRINITY_DN7579_c1_g1_i2.p1 TRINITY_DN7579_c1_g1~~TRINITY_DN7579_c1_g1_i2.p1  ORF type:complete len:677 (-),score=154.92 TRINITY_DN7579_c1_g1_i2:8-2038(-)